MTESLIGAAAPRGLRPATEFLTGRLLVQVGVTDAPGLIGSAARPSSGLVVTGKQALTVAARLLRAHPGTLVIADSEPESSWHATAEEPFSLGEADLFDEPSLQRSLDRQRDAGALVALTPSGHISAGDSAALKAVVKKENEVDRNDVVVRLPCDAAWATPAYAKQLSAVIGRSNHPVALSLADGQDPLERSGAAQALWDMAATHQHLILWRTDLAGLAHLVNGGAAAAIGVSATLRHGVRPGRRGFVNDLADKTPYILLPDWLRYMRGSRIERIFAATAPPRCTCSVCKGSALDRFDTDDGDKLIAQQHNIAMIQQLSNGLTHMTRSQRLCWWERTTRQAVQTHAVATANTRVAIVVPRALRVWSEVAEASR